MECASTGCGLSLVEKLAPNNREVFSYQLLHEIQVLADMQRRSAEL